MKIVLTEQQVCDILSSELLKEDQDNYGPKTVGEYLQKLLYTVWTEGEDFSSKRPFGAGAPAYEYLFIGANAYEYPVIKAIESLGLFAIEWYEEDGDRWIDDYDRQKFDQIMKALLRQTSLQWHNES